MCNLRAGQLLLMPLIVQSSLGCSTTTYVLHSKSMIKLAQSALEFRILTEPIQFWISFYFLSTLKEKSTLIIFSNTKMASVF